MKSKILKYHWTDIRLYEDRTNEPFYNLGIGPACYFAQQGMDQDLSMIVGALRGYRNDGCICQYWLVDPSDYDAGGVHLDPNIDILLEQAGPDPEEIDFSGLDEVTAALDEEDYERACELVLSSRAHAASQSGRA